MLHAKVALRGPVPGECSRWVCQGHLVGYPGTSLPGDLNLYLLALSQKYCMLRGHSL